VDDILLHLILFDKYYFSIIPPYTHEGTLNDPVLFAEGVINTKDDEFEWDFTPGFKEHLLFK